MNLLSQRNRMWFRLAPMLLLAACASQPTPSSLTTLSTQGVVPQSWQVSLPHEGQSAQLHQWWERQGDPLLVRLIDAAGKASPTLAAAMSRIAEARATSAASGARLLPNLDLNVSSVRTNQQSTVPTGTTTQGALQASWELDLFGAARAGQGAARARLIGAEAGWHEARVSLAAETASLYTNLRACELRVRVLTEDAASRNATARLTEAATRAGFQSPATFALARASAAEGNSRRIQEQTTCDIYVKALVALTAIDEPTLRAALAAQPASLPQNADINIETLPAKTLEQRPDLVTAQTAVAAASDDIGAARAAQYPRLSLSGSIGGGSFRSDGNTINTNTWSVGPLSLTLPIFDAGQRRADVNAAIARYTTAESQYRASVRNAVREVEEALLNLRSTAERSADARVMVEGYNASFSATQQRYQSGLASLSELEEARRIRLAAENALVGLQSERTLSWIALYRAAGGGWRASEAATAKLASN